MGTISSYTAATSFDPGDVLIGNDGTTTKKFGPDAVFNHTRTVSNGDAAVHPWWLYGIQSNTDGATSDVRWYGIQSTIYSGYAAAIGTVHAITSEVVVVGSGSQSNEQTPLLTVARYDIGTGYSQSTGPVGRCWGADLNVHGPIAVQPGLLNGVSAFINNYYDGSPSGTASGGVWICTKAGAGGGVDGLHAAATTYAVDVGLGIVGSASGTGAGFTTGIQVGGTGSGWAVTASKIGTGISVSDYATYGIRIVSKHSSAAASVPALTVANGQGRVGIGIEAPGAPLEVKGTDDTTPTVLVTQVASQTANAIQVMSSAGGLIAAVGPNGNMWLGGGTSSFPTFSHWSDIDSGLYIDAATGNTVGISAGGSSRFSLNATQMGFQGTAPISKPTVTGSRGANAALASLLTALANYGLITDSSS